MRKRVAMLLVIMLGSVNAKCQKVELGNYGNLSVTVGYGASGSGQACTPGGTVSFTAEPQQLSSSDGVTAKTGQTAQMSSTSREIARDVETGVPSYGCVATASFLNLASGNWKVIVGGAGTQRTECPATVTKQGETKVKVWSEQCYPG